MFGLLVRARRAAVAAAADAGEREGAELFRQLVETRDRARTCPYDWTSATWRGLKCNPSSAFVNSMSSSSTRVVEHLVQLEEHELAHLGLGRRADLEDDRRERLQEREQVAVEPVLLLEVPLLGRANLRARAWSG